MRVERWSKRSDDGSGLRRSVNTGLLVTMPSTSLSLLAGWRLDSASLPLRHVVLLSMSAGPP